MHVCTKKWFQYKELKIDGPFNENIVVSVEGLLSYNLIIIVYISKAIHSREVFACRSTQHHMFDR